jgi:colanic acid/amylovoran biosynthesis glycosyltransferase
MPGTLGYLIPEFPGQTHIWMWREIVALRSAGVNVELVSTSQPAIDSCKHAFADEGRRSTHYLFPPRAIAVLKTILTRPIGTCRALGYIAGLRQSTFKRKLRALGLLACACDLVQWARRKNVTHVHAHSCADAAHACALAERLGGPSYSLTLHGDLPVYGVDHASKMARATCITTDGPHLVEQILNHVGGVSREKLMSNWMGVNTDVFVDAGKREATSGRLRMLTVARLHLCKGHKFALRAMRQLVDEGLDLTYTLAGDGPHRAEIEAEISLLKLEDRVKLLGTCGEDRVRELMQSADVFLLPSIGIGEAGPISVMEAMSTGLPVIASIIGATPVMIDDGKTGFLTAQEDIAAIAARLRELASDVELRHRLAAAARAHAVAEFDSRNTAIRLLRLIEKTSGKVFGA